MAATLDVAEVQRSAEMRRALLKSLWRAVLALFLVPAIAFVFVNYVDWRIDNQFFARVEAGIASHNLAGPAAEATRAVLHAHPPSAVCDAEPGDVARFYGNHDCSAWSPSWQFRWAWRLSFFSLVFGAATLVAVGVLGRLAFLGRRWQYGTLMVAWRMLMASSVVQVLVQGLLTVWLAFWVTAYFFERYYVKLIAIAGISAGFAAFVVIVRIFYRPKSTTNVEGARLSETVAPRLWQRVREIAGRLGTAAPDHIIGGIDANFFVTEMPVTFGHQVLSGRTLFVSIPLLRILSTAQADAVLGHELAHFSGGDTVASARLNPTLLRYDHYLHALHQGGVSRVVLPTMQLYRLLLQWAMSRDSRAREFKADQTAASVTSPQSVTEALVKIAAYSRYRRKTEEALIARRERLDDQIGLGASVALGLLPYATSNTFAEEMSTAPVPHPFDSHPPMTQRMQNVGYQLDIAAFCDVVSAKPGACWVDEIDGADQIEARLWAVYESRFASQHEQLLAYRYEPANELERAIVLKHFPPIAFPLTKGHAIEISYAGISRTGDNLLRWDDIAGLKYEQSSFMGDKLVIRLSPNSRISGGTWKIKVRGLGKNKKPLLAAINRYWHRNQVMRSGAANKS